MPLSLLQEADAHLSRPNNHRSVLYHNPLPPLYFLGVGTEGEVLDTTEAWLLGENVVGGCWMTCRHKCL